MGKVNVNLEGVVYTNLETPTPWTSTHTHTQFKRNVNPEHTAGNIADTLVERQQGTAITTSDEYLKNRGGTQTETTSTHIFSIITNGFVVATFTIFGTAVSPPRGVSQPPSILPPWEIILIFLSTDFFCFILFRALYHYRRLEMMMKNEDAAKGTANSAAGDNETSDNKFDDALEMKDILVEVPVTDKTGKRVVRSIQTRVKLGSFLRPMDETCEAP